MSREDGRTIASGVVVSLDTVTVIHTSGGWVGDLEE